MTISELEQEVTIPMFAYASLNTAVDQLYVPILSQAKRGTFEACERAPSDGAGRVWGSMQ